MNTPGPTFDARAIDSILKSALERAGFNLRVELSNAMQARVADTAGLDLVENNISLIERSAEENLDYFYNTSNRNCMHSVLNLFIERNDISPSDIKILRLVCKAWQEIIEGFNYGLLQQLFLVNVTSIEQFTAITNRILLPKETVEVTSSRNSETDLDLISKFVVNQNLKIKLNLSDDDIVPFIARVMILQSQSKFIETISFEKIAITEDNKVKIQSLLVFISGNEATYFSGLKKLVFGMVNTFNFMIPKFQNLESLIFKNTQGIVSIICCPALKRLDYKYIACRGLDQIKEIVELRRMTFIPEVGSLLKFNHFFDCPKNASWSGCIETFVIDKIEDLKFKRVQSLIDTIHSKQELFSNLKKIMLDITACTTDLSKALVFPKFLNDIEVVYFTKCDPSAVENRGHSLRPELETELIDITEPLDYS